MTGGDAFGEEMELMRTITEDQELVAFARTLRAELLQPPEGADALALPVRLAEAARAAAGNGASLRASENGGRSHAARRNGTGSHPARRRGGKVFGRPLLRLAAAVVAIPLLFTGLAVAGVELPDPAADAFESVGIELPNQSDDRDAHGEATGTGTPEAGDSAGSEAGQETSGGKVDHGGATEDPSPAAGRPEGSHESGKDKAGELGLAPESPKAPPGHGVVKPEKPAAGPPESPGSSSERIPDGAGGNNTVVGPLFPFESPDEGSPPEKP